MIEEAVNRQAEVRAYVGWRRVWRCAGSSADVHRKHRSRAGRQISSCQLKPRLRPSPCRPRKDGRPCDCPTYTFEVASRSSQGQAVAEYSYRHACPQEAPRAKDALSRRRRCSCSSDQWLLPAEAEWQGRRRYQAGSVVSGMAVRGRRRKRRPQTGARLHYQRCVSPACWVVPSAHSLVADLLALFLQPLYSPSPDPASSALVLRPLAAVNHHFAAPAEPPHGSDHGRSAQPAQ